jgi:[acyl-carrier-protein] S-malonyltransferase
MDLTAILFPGQGSLTANAGEEARDRWPELCDLACELVGHDPFARAAESTRFAQPAIFLASMAAWREREDELAGADVMAGHSLGELSALAAAGALQVDHALALVVLRGRLMGGAADARPGGGMVALLGGTREQVEELAERHDVSVANDNAHAMTPAVRPFRRALEHLPIAEPRVPVISGATAEPFTDIPAELSRGLVAPVRWREVMGRLGRLGATRFVDVGPGAVLARLVKRNAVELEGDVVAA